jgi:hypothetical protein
MSVSIWILLGILGFFAVSLVVGLSVAAILASIGRDFSRLIEFEPLDPTAPDPHEDAAASAPAELVGHRSSG